MNQAVVCIDNGGGEVSFGSLKLHNFLFDRILGNQAVGEDLTCLADAVGTVSPSHIAVTGSREKRFGAANQGFVRLPETYQAVCSDGCF